MRAFCVSIIFIVAVAVIGAFSLGYFQESSSTVYSSATGAKLDRTEAAVNNYGRQVVPD